MIVLFTLIAIALVACLIATFAPNGDKIVWQRWDRFLLFYRRSYLRIFTLPIGIAAVLHMVAYPLGLTDDVLTASGVIVLLCLVYCWVGFVGDLGWRGKQILYGFEPPPAARPTGAMMLLMLCGMYGSLLGMLLSPNY